MRLTTYCWIAVALGVACAAISWLGVAGWIAVMVVAASIAAHVAGNALGTRLREGADRQLERVPRPLEVPLPPHLPAHLQQRTGVGQVVPVSVGIGAVCGGLAGSYGLLVFAAASPAGAVLGGVSSAVIGGLGGFLGASFVEIVRTSVREAIAAERRG